METFVLWLFLLTIFGIYALAALAVVRLVLRRTGRRNMEGIYVQRG